MRMKRGRLVTLGVISLLAFAVAGMDVRASGPLKVSDHGSLQSAIDAAAPGETVVIDVDTPGAVLDKRLTIQGLRGTGASGVIHGVVVPPYLYKAALVLTSDASGSEIVNVAMEGASGIVSAGQPVDHITVRGCTIVAADAAIFLDAIDSSGWSIEHNTIRIENRPDFQQAFASGVYLRFQRDARIAHNEISGLLTKGTFQPATSGGVVILGGGRIEVLQNEIDVNADGPPIPWTIEAVMIQATSSGVEDITVAMNNFSRSASSFGPHAVTYVGTVDAASDVTGLGAYDHFDSASPVVAGLAIAGNLSPDGGARRELSGSDIPVGHLLRP